MVNIVPFRGFRPKQQFAQKVSSPPYDVISSEEARKMAENNECSFLKVIKPEIDLDPSVDIYDDQVYLKGAENLRKFLQEGILQQDTSRCFYIYRQHWHDHQQTGLVAGASILDYQQDKIKKHEHTRPDKENDRTRHIDTLNANTGPVFLTYRQQNNIDAIIEKCCSQQPEYDFTTEDQIRHIVWVVSDNAIVAEIQKAFENIPELYVADGHHRSAAGTRVGEQRKAKNPLHTGREAYNYFLAVIFPNNQLKILAYNRVVKEIPFSEQEFLDKVQASFVVETSETPVEPQEAHCFGMFWHDKWYKLTAKPEVVVDDPIKKLDVYILQEYLFNAILGIENPRTDKRLDFIGGMRGISYLQQQAQGNSAAFVLYPVSVNDLIAVSDAGQVMPPKSTWFEPKLRSGLIIRPLI